MKRYFIGIIALLASAAMFAGTPTDKLAELVENLQEQCPVDIHRGWVIQSVTADDESVTMTMIVDVAAEDFAQMQINSDALKERFLQGFSTKAVRPDGLLAETVASELPLKVDIVSPESVETVSIAFTPGELAAALDKSK